MVAEAHAQVTHIELPLLFYYTVCVVLQRKLWSVSLLFHFPVKSFCTEHGLDGPIAEGFSLHSPFLRKIGQIQNGKSNKASFLYEKKAFYQK